METVQCVLCMVPSRLRAFVIDTVQSLVFKVVVNFLDWSKFVFCNHLL